MRSHRITGREWPLLLGMVLAGLLVIASMRVSSEAAQSTSAPQEAVAATRAPNVASPLTPSTEPDAAAGAGAGVAPNASAAAAAKKKGKASTSSAAAAGAPAAGAPAADAPAADAPSAGGGGGGGGTSQPQANEPAASEPQRPAADSPNAPSRSTAPVAPMFSVKGNGGQVTASGVTFTMSAPTHKPTVGQSWTLKATAARGEKPLAGKVVVDAVYQGEVVAHMHSGRLSNGAYEHNFTWPQEAAGHPLTIKVSITAGGVSRAFLYDVVVRPAG